MNARRLTGSALSQVLAKAVEAAIGKGMRANADRFSQAIDEMQGAPTPPLGGRAGEGGDAMSPPDNTDPAQAGPLPGPPRRGGREADAPRRSTTKTGSRSLEVTFAAPALFAREFGGFDTPPDPVIAPAIERLRRKPS